MEDILNDNISSDFYNNDSEFGFDSIMCTLIKIKKNKKNKKNKKKETKKIYKILEVLCLYKIDNL